MGNKTSWKPIAKFTIITVFILSGCYSMPSGSKRFLDDYNSRHPLPPAPEKIEEPLSNLKTYQHKTISYEEWKESEHFQDTMAKGSQTSANIRYILGHIPDDGVLVDKKGNVVLTFTGFVEIDPIGSVRFPVIYPQTGQKDNLTVLETLSALQGNAANKKLNI
jgi:hypothetical protein